MSFLNKTNIDKIINNICFINDYEEKEKPVIQKIRRCFRK